MATIDLETAKRVREAFGPCTVLYEACDDRDLERDLVDFDGKPMTVREWIGVRLTVEAIDAERCGGRFDRKPVLARLRAAGLWR